MIIGDVVSCYWMILCVIHALDVMNLYVFDGIDPKWA